MTRYYKVIFFILFWDKIEYKPKWFTTVISKLKSKTSLKLFTGGADETKKLKAKKLSNNKFKKLEKKYENTEQSVLKCAEKNCKEEYNSLADHNQSLEKKCRGRNVTAVDKIVCKINNNNASLGKAFTNCKKSKCKAQMNKSSKLGNEYYKQWLLQQNN